MKRFALATAVLFVAACGGAKEEAKTDTAAAAPAMAPAPAPAADSAAAMTDTTKHDSAAADTTKH